MTVLVLFVVGTVCGQVVRLGPEFRVNTNTTGTQGLPTVAVKGTGEFVVIWQSYGQDGSGDGVFGRRYDSGGVPLGGEFRVNTHAPSDQDSAIVAMDRQGGFAVLWESYLQDGSSSGIFGQRYDSGGALRGGEFLVNSYTPGEQRSPAADYDGSGDFVAVWESAYQDGSGAGIFGQRYSGAGPRQGSEFQVNSYTRDDQVYPDVGKDGAGGFVVVWQSYDQDHSDYAIVGQRFRSTGAKDGQDFQVNAYATGAQEHPSIAMGGTGAFVVVWESPQDGSGTGIFGQRYDSAGTKSGGEFRVNTYTTFNQRAPSIALGSDGGFVVVELLPGWTLLRCLRPAVPEQRCAARQRVPGEHLDNQRPEGSVGRHG